MVMAHSSCMCYGHFSAQDILLTKMNRAPVTQAWRIDSDWTKCTSDSAVVVFFMDMSTAETAIYRLDTPRAVNSAAVTTSMITSWHMEIRVNRFPHRPLLFPGVPPMTQRRARFQSWLRQKITVTVPGFALP